MILGPPRCPAGPLGSLHEIFIDTAFSMRDERLLQTQNVQRNKILLAMPLRKHSRKPGNALSTDTSDRKPRRHRPQHDGVFVLALKAGRARNSNVLFKAGSFLPISSYNLFYRAQYIRIF
jgi:hypothetical protein